MSLRPVVDETAIEAEIDRIRSLGLDELRNLWRRTLASSPPPAFGRDLIVRFLCWQLQQQAFGGFDPDTVRLLDGLARGERFEAERRLKSGTVLVREYQGKRHTVTVVRGGYVWGETTYASLSAVARAITGTTWNGHRFFGLRTGRDRSEQDADQVSGPPVSGEACCSPRRAKTHRAGINASFTGRLPANKRRPTRGRDEAT